MEVLGCLGYWDIWGMKLLSKPEHKGRGNILPNRAQPRVCHQRSIERLRLVIGDGVIQKCIGSQFSFLPPWQRHFQPRPVVVKSSETFSCAPLVHVHFEGLLFHESKPISARWKVILFEDYYHRKMTAVLNPVRNVSTHFVQDQVTPRRTPVVAATSSSSSSAAAGTPTPQPKNLKRFISSSLQETIRHVTLAKKSREKISHESNESSEIEKTTQRNQTHRSQAPPPSAFSSHFHRPSIFRRSPENSNASNGSLNNTSAPSSGTTTPISHKSTDRYVNPRSLTVKTDNLPSSSSTNEPPHRPRVLRKQSTRVKAAGGASVSHSSKNRLSGMLVVVFLLPLSF